MSRTNKRIRVQVDTSISIQQRYGNGEGERFDEQCLLHDIRIGGVVFPAVVVAGVSGKFSDQRSRINVRTRHQQLVPQGYAGKDNRRVEITIHAKPELGTGDAPERQDTVIAAFVEYEDLARLRYAFGPIAESCTAV